MALSDLFSTSARGTRWLGSPRSGACSGDSSAWTTKTFMVRDFWGFHSGSQALTREAAYFGQLTCGFPVNLTTGWDLANPRHQEAMRLEVLMHKPRILVLAPTPKP